MKRLLAAVVLATMASGADRTQEAERLLKTARTIETVDGNLKAAISQYRKVVQTGVRKAAAEALLGIADCHRKLGDSEARKIYEQILREYPDQGETAAVARARLGLRPASDVPGVVTREVWSGPGVDILGAVSPDGRYLSFTDWETGDLALRDLTTGQNRRLTSKESWTVSDEFAEESIFSPDGKHIIYSWHRKDMRWDIRRIPISGAATSPQVLYESKSTDWIAPYDCTSDGRFVAVQFYERDSVTQIGLIDTKDKSLRVLKRVSLPGSERMFFSPDDSYLAFELPASPETDQRDVHVITADGSREVRAVTGPAMDVAMGWTPDGSHLLFASDRSGTMSLWAQPMRDGRSNGAPVLVKLDIGRGWSMGMTRQGALYYGVRTGGPNLHLAAIDLASGGIVGSPVRMEEHFIGVNAEPDWSADGKHLVYRSRPDSAGSRSLLAIRSMDSGDVRRLRPGLRFWNWPRWSADGRSIGVHGSTFEGRQGIFRIDVETGKAEVLAFAQGDSRLSHPQWSRGGDKLHYLSADRAASEVRLIERNLASGAERPVATWPLRQSPSIAVSPDGAHVAVATVNPAVNETVLSVRPLPDGPPVELLRIAGSRIAGGEVAWTPDGRAVVFRKSLSPDGTEGEFWIAPLSGSPRRIELAIPRARSLRVHPDGRRAVFTNSVQSPLEVWVLENFLPRLTARK